MAKRLTNRWRLVWCSLADIGVVAGYCTKIIGEEIPKLSERREHTQSDGQSAVHFYTLKSAMCTEKKEYCF